jgi:hypothetical protein
VGHAGNDTLTATAASVLYGGSGDDRLVIGQAMITALQSPMGAGGNSTRLARINGGSGRDTLVLQGAGLTLDLTQVASQAASNPDGGSRIDSIEIIDLTGTGNNTLILSLSDVLDLAAAQTFQANGRKQLMVRGNAGDQVNIVIDLNLLGWTQANSPMTLDGATYAVWNHATARASVYVQNGVGVTAPRSADMIALDTIQAAAQANNASASAPAVSVYADAGVTGVTADNLLVINNLLNTSAINGAAVDTAAKVQALVNAYNTVLAAADGLSDGDARPTQAQYELLGLTGLSPVSTALLGSVIDRSTTSSVDTVAKLQAMANAAQAVVAGAAGGGTAPSASQLQLLGVTGVTDANLQTMLIALAGTADDGSGVDTWAELQGLVARTQPGTGIQLSAVAGGTGGFMINGGVAAISLAGDVNGDGLADLIVANPSESTGPSWDWWRGSSAGRSYVVFGKTSSIAIDLSAILSGSGGFAIQGQSASDYSGMSVSALGDLNGDGLDDLLIGAPSADPSGRTDAGRSYVVFGQSGTATVNLSAVANGSGGYVINGHCANDKSGSSVSAAGDVNGDGLPDFIIAGPSGTEQTRRHHVVFGQSGTKPIDLSAVAAGTGGFVINAHCRGDLSGLSVSSAGDVNGDGLADLIVGGFRGSQLDNHPGRSYVVFGKADGAAVDLSAVANGNNGFAINFQDNFASAYSVSGAGDVNGDGLADLIVGALNSNSPWVHPDGGSYSGLKYNGGRSYVVFGKTSGAAVDLSAIGGVSVSQLNSGFTGTGGFVIHAEAQNDRSGISVSHAGDLNGDGLADLLVGAWLGDPNGVSDAGRSYVVFGKTDTRIVELARINRGGGFTIDGQFVEERTGYLVSAAGDVNGDGLADLLVTNSSRTGKSYVIFGSNSAAATGVSIDLMGTTDADTLRDNGVSQTLVGNAGNDTLMANAASVLYGGSGNDRFEIGQSMVLALQSPLGAGGNVSKLARIDGGGGRDTLALAGSGLSLNLTTVASQAASSPEGGSRIEGIEIIDLTGTGNNTLWLSLLDMMELGSGNLFEATGRQQLMVQGNAGDQVNLSLVINPASWAQATLPVSIEERSYAVWNHATAPATIYVQTGVTVNSSRTSQILALESISAAAQANNAAGTTPSLTTYADAGVRGVTANNLALVNNLLNASAISGASVDTVGELQAVIDAFDAVLTAADGNADSDAGANLTQYHALGLSDLTAPAASLLSSAIDRMPSSSVDTWDELRGLADAARAVMTGASGGTLPTLAQLQALGVTGVSSTNLDLMQRTIAAGADDGREVDTYHELQDLTLPGIGLSAIASGRGGFVINGQSAGDRSGWNVSGIGDFNGDGLEDLLVGANPSAGAERSFVVFGRTGTSAIDLSAVAAGSGGFSIQGQSLAGMNGRTVSAAGDVNGDGLADLLISAPTGDPTLIVQDAGRSYVVFGNTQARTVSLANVANGSGGFVINGQGASDTSGWSISAAGDVNGDGLADLILGAPASDPAAGSDAGRSYVVFGRSQTTAVELSALHGTAGPGFVINGESSLDRSGYSVSAAGDVNGDGLGDLIIGAIDADPSSMTSAGRSYVVFGKTNQNPVNLSSISAGTGGFVIHGACQQDRSGWSVSAAGDLDRDGLADLLVSAPTGDPSGVRDAGQTFVVFGKTSTAAVSLSSSTRLSGQRESDNSGWSVSSLGDVNGDGLPDVMIGAPTADTLAGADAGRTYVAFTRTHGGLLQPSLDSLAQNNFNGGFIVDGQSAGDQSGHSVSAAGDVNGDGLPDFIIGAPYSDPGAGADAGKSYVVFGTPRFKYPSALAANENIFQMGTIGWEELNDRGTAQILIGDAGDDALIAAAASVLYGGSGNDRFEISQSMIDGLMRSVGDINKLPRIDGGSGTDTLALKGKNLVLDLTRIANAGATYPFVDGRIDGIEIIDISGSGSNQLVLNVSSVNELSLSKWPDLRIRGDTDDVLDLADGAGTSGWTRSGSMNSGGETFVTWYHSSPFVSLYVQEGLQVL